MKNKNFRIKRSKKMDELVSKNPLLKKTLQKIVGGRTGEPGEGPFYNRLSGYMEQREPNT